MENIANRLNMVIDYIEKHLTGDIDQTEIAKIACCSFYDVGRMFSLIADINISDYVRKRRLTLAGAELKYHDAKVMDVALKYGYESPVSFARAFQAFHGFNPSQVSMKNATLNVFPRLIYQICVREVLNVTEKEILTIDGKEYEASYLGESDMSTWSKEYAKRKFWRVENANDDFQGRLILDQVLPYNNYPPISIEIGQIFVIDYYRYDGEVERKYYVSDGTVWKDMPCTHEFILDYMQPLRTDEIMIGGKEYEASYFGEQDMSEWSEYATKRAFWRLENVNGEFENSEKTENVLPYNNYPLFEIENGQVFVIDYLLKDGTIDRRYYIADGTVWEGMPSTRQIII